MGGKKILLVATESGPAMSSFASAVINNLASSEFFDVTSIVMSKKRSGGYEGKIDKKNKTYYVVQPQNIIKKIIYKIWPWEVIKLIKKEIRRTNPERVLFLTGDCQLSLFVLLNPSDKYSYVVHDLFPHEVEVRNVKERLLNLWIKYGYKIMRWRCDTLTTSSLFQLESLKKMYINKRVCFTKFPSLLNKEGMLGTAKVPELKDESNYILFFGGINLYKGVDVLIKAFLMLPPKINKKLVIAGRGTSLKYEKNASIIRLDRFIKDEELKDLFEKASLVVYPYRSITMSGVLSFPYYFGNKVLCSNVPFFLQNATENTFFFENGNAIDLCEKMTSILGNAKQIEKKSVYDAVFSLKDFVESYVDLLECRR